MFLKVKEAFSWAYRGVDVQSYAVGDVLDTEDEDLIRVAIEEGWVEETTGNEDLLGEVSEPRREGAAVETPADGTEESTKPRTRRLTAKLETK